MDAAPRFTVCGLLYGDFPDLAERLLESFARLGRGQQVDFRIGMNDCSDATHSLVHGFALRRPGTRQFVGCAPYYKYPLMRRMFTQPPIATPYTMWFDDDSCLLPGAPPDWLDLVDQQIAGADMIGSVWQWQLRGYQLEAIQAQPWYTGDLKRPDTAIAFCTGGWWTIRTSILERWDWPMQGLEHNGGDVLLGALMREQKHQMRSWAQFVGVNCDSTFKNSSAKRRGFSQPPFGVNPVPKQEKPMSFHDILSEKRA